MDPAVLLQQMQQQMQQQHQQIMLLQQQLQQQPPPQQQQPQQQQPAAAAPRVERPRLPPPSQYDGRSAVALDGWLRELQQQFEWYATDDDAGRLRFAGALLKGTALDWWSSLSDAVHQPAGAGVDSLRPTTYVDFVARLRGRFQPINSAQTARVQLDELRQGPKQSVHDYISAFRALLVRVPDMSEGDRVHRFLRGLRSNVATQLRIQGVSNLDAAISMAARVGSIAEFGSSSNIGPQHSSVTPASAASSSSDAMELDNIEGLDRETDGSSSSSAPVTQAQLTALINAMKSERGSNRSKGTKTGPKDVTAAIAKRFKLTPEQVREHFDKGQCFNCDGTGHSSRACTKPPKVN